MGQRVLARYQVQAVLDCVPSMAALAVALKLKDALRDAVHVAAHQQLQSSAWSLRAPGVLLASRERCLP